MKKKILCICLSFLLFASPLCYGSPSPNYQISEEELTELENILKELKSTNEMLLLGASESQRRLIEVQKELKASRADLEASKAELQRVKKELLLSKIESEKVRTDLIEANKELQMERKSLKEYEKKVKGKIAKLEVQNVILGAAAAYFFFRGGRP